MACLLILSGQFSLTENEGTYQQVEAKEVLIEYVGAFQLLCHKKSALVHSTTNKKRIEWNTDSK